MAEAQTPANVQAKPGDRPDPSVLTTQQLWREEAHAKELNDAKDRLNDYKISSVEKAITLAHQDAERFPTEIDKAIAGLDKVYIEKFKYIEMALLGEHNLKEEKFNKVEQRFQLIETNRIEQKAEAANALITALTSAKDVINEKSINTIAAAAKSETAITKQMDQQNELMRSMFKAMDDKIGNVNERLLKIEGITTGKKDFWGYIIGAIGLLATLATIVAMIIKNSGR